MKLSRYPWDGFFSEPPSLMDVSVTVNSFFQNCWIIEASVKTDIWTFFVGSHKSCQFWIWRSKRLSKHYHWTFHKHRPSLKRIRMKDQNVSCSSLTLVLPISILESRENGKEGQGVGGIVWVILGSWIQNEKHPKCDCLLLFYLW